MGKTLDAIDADLAGWIGRQHLYFVASAPLSGDGMVNCSPKGLDTLAVLDEHSVAYLDITGSGVETIAHVQENGRIVIMLCAFEGAPRIVRLHGTGEVVRPGDAVFAALRERFPDYPGVRSIIRVDVKRISSSCGFGVPLFAYQGERDAMIKWATQQGDAKLDEYQATYNRESIDGLPGVVTAARAGA